MATGGYWGQQKPQGGTSIGSAAVSGLQPFLGQGGPSDPAKSVYTGGPRRAQPNTAPPDPGKGSAFDPTPNPSTPPSGGGAAPPEAPLAGPGYYEDFYKKHGQDLMNTPSASEDLYSRGVAGSNPYYDYAQQQATKAINDAAAARGNFNSSYTMKNIGNAVADLRGQQAKGLTDLAGQADTGKFGRFDRSAQYADRAQGRTEDRLRGGIDAYGDLARGQSGLVDNFYGKAGDQMSMANLAAIEAQLKAAGMDAAEVKAYMDFLTNGIDAIVPG